MRAYVTDLEQLLEVSALITSTLNLKDLLTKILETAGRLMSAEASNFMLLNSEKTVLNFEVMLGHAGKIIKQQGQMEVGVGIAGWVAKNGEPLLIEDAYQDSRFLRDFDLKTGFRTKSILCTPLIVKGETIGVAQILNKKDGSSFSADDQEFFSKFCNIASLAIDNALMHEKVLEQDRLRRDMALAEEIQKNFLPIKTPYAENIRIEFRSLSCRQVGGDVVEFAELADGKIAAFIGDVSGKGFPAALFAAKFSTEFQYELKVNGEGGDLMTRLSRIVAGRSTRGMFVTGIYAVIDPKDGKVQLVNAGHLYPIVVGPQAGQVRVIESEGFPPLGIVEDQVYNSSEFTLAPGERMILMTDGVTDVKNKKGINLGQAKIQEILASCPGNAIARLMLEVKKFIQQSIQADDVTLIGIGFGRYNEFTFTSDTSSIGPVRRLVEERARSMKFTEKQTGRIALTVTEAIANIIKHTYKMETDQKIQLGIGVHGPELRIYLRDWGPKQDLSYFVSRPLDEIRPGGLGIHYMKEIMDVVEFDDSHTYGNESYLQISKTSEPIKL
jgi:sigma-B regulation protein RsbU (phosphoserine phosphatase)